MGLFENVLLACGVLFVVTFLRTLMGRPKTTSTDDCHSFRWLYLSVYLVMMAADWLQGPYVYRLYEFYGFSPAECGVLFIAGFGSSLVFGILAGAIADRYGRRLACILYAISYILSCLTKHSTNYSVLMLGRVLGGFATSILWSAFESWMVAAHRARKLPEDDIGGVFNTQIMANGLVAIMSGVVAQHAVDFFGGHPVIAFDLSIGFLVVGLVLILRWEENYGDTESGAANLVGDALATIREDRSVLYVGVMQALFEGGMYTFVFMWTPLLSAAYGDAIPHGNIFAAFMMCVSIGGTVHELLRRTMAEESFIRGVFLIAAVAMATPLLVPKSPLMIMIAFCVFEACVGIFWPTIMSLRAKVVPEATRSTVINCFRVPLNLTVCVVLKLQGSMQVETVFVFIVGFFIVAAAASQALYTTLLRKDARVV
eukprot:TRINITY_DN659_c0_g1_i1.p1 TRINITY_DN659_c0_g1~~TRINITY_DN659_c0_g1_i1.p1  ORF type:complete len:427 (-),score=113.18 TRINITY_DN659_c0_g1_i1:84-1364(-)